MLLPRGQPNLVQVEVEVDVDVAHLREHGP